MSNISKISNSRLNQIDWEKLKVFYGVAQQGNYEKASHSLGITISSISKNIIQLEKEVGVILINRKKGSHGNILTEAGQIFLKATSEIYKQIEEAISEIENRERISGKISIATTRGFGMAILIPKLLKFKKLHQDILFDITMVDVIQNLVNYSADMYVTPKFAEGSNLVHDFVGKFDYHVYASQGYLEQYGVPHSIEELDTHKIIAFGYRSFLPQQSWLLTAGMQKGMEREPTILFDDVNGLLMAAENGEGLCIFPEYITLLNPNLIRVFPNYHLGSIEFFIIRQAETQQSRKFSLLVPYLTGSPS